MDGQSERRPWGYSRISPGIRRKKEKGKLPQNGANHRAVDSGPGPKPQNRFNLLETSILLECDRITGRPFFSTVLVRYLLGNSGPPLATPVPNLLFLCGLSSAGVAQLVEHLICNQRVGGSIPSASSSSFKRGVQRSESRHGNMKGLVSLDTSPFCVFAGKAPEDNAGKIRTTRCRCLTFFADGWVSG